METIVDRVVSHLENLGKSISSLPAEALHQAIEQLIPSATVDMETKDVEFGIAVPDWAFGANFSPNDVCPAPSSRSQALCWTHQVLTQIVCTYQHKRGSHSPVYYQCGRRAA